MASMKFAASKPCVVSLSQWVLLAAIATTAMAAEQPREKWVAPASAARNINPIPTSPESVKAGRKVFSDNCVSCHGETGKGDGLLVPHLPVKPANLSSAEVWQQSDGIIFWKVTTGRQPMPNWGAPGEAGLTELKRWNVINYLRASFAPPGSVNPAAPPVAVVPVPAVPVGPPDVLPTTPEETKALLMKLLREQREMRAEIEQLKTGRGGAAPGPTTGTATGPGSPAAVASAPARQDDLEDVQKQVEAIRKDVTRFRPGTEEFFLAGDAFVGYTAQRGSNSTFSAGMAPVILWKPTSNLLFESSFDLGLNTDPDTSSSTSINLKIADVSFLVNDWLTVGGGLFVTPFGVYHNHFDPPWINKFADDPLAFSDGGIAPGSSLGIFVRGAELIGNGKIVYDAYVTNGPNLITANKDAAGSLAFDNFSDLNNDKAVGGRLGYIPIPSMELGYSIMSAEVQPSGFTRTRALLQAVDFNYRPDVPAIAGTLDLRAEWVWSDVGRVTYDRSGSLGFGPLRYGNVRDGGYVQLCYRPTHVSNEILRNLEFVSRFDMLHVPQSAPGGGTERRLALGVDYWINPQTVFKVQYEFDSRSRGLGPAQDGLLLQMGLGF